MKNVQMCPNCNCDNIDKFEKLMLNKGIQISKGCIGQCGDTSPIAFVDGDIVTADTVEELAESI